MSELPSQLTRKRQRRADAERSITAILQAAVRVLDQRPDASVEDIATAAGLTRQTVYAHYPSREALISAVIDQVTEATVAALDAAELGEGSPTQALIRLLDAGWHTPEPYPFLAHLRPMSPEESHDRHRPILDRYEGVIRRGQATGDFDPQLSPAWLVAALIGLAHTAGEEVTAGRMTHQAAGAALQESTLRLCGAKTAQHERDCPDSG